MPKEALDIHAPVLGVDRRLAYQSQPPYTCANAMNYWPRDRFQGRMRGGDRPGLEKAFPAGVTGPVHLLANVRVIESGAVANLVPWTDDFTGPFFAMPPWSIMQWVGSLLKLFNGQCTLSDHPVRSLYPFLYYDVPIPVGECQGGMILDSLNIDTGEDITVQLGINLTLSYNIRLQQISYQPPDAQFQIYLGLDDSDPKLEPGVLRIEVDHAGSTGRINYAYMDASLAWVESSVHLAANEAFPKVFRVDLSETGNTATIQFPGLASSIVFDIGAPAPGRPGQRIGFAMYAGAEQDPIYVYTQRLNYFHVEYTVPAIEAIQNRNMVVAAGGTNATTSKLDIRYEKTLADLTALGEVHAATVNDDGRQLQAAEILGRLYIVGEKDVQMWCCCLSGTGKIGTIQEIHDEGTVFAFDDAPDGTPPDSCTWICAWNNRLVCGGDWDDPQNVFMAKWNHPENWVYTSVVGSAVKLNTTGIDTGKLGEPINAGIPTSDDYLILGCLNSLYVLRGDPTLQGPIDRLSASIGIVAPQAWARGPDGETVFLSQDGIYGIPPGITSYPQSVSRERLPQELRGIDTHNHRILMAYDVHNRGVFIGITPMFGSGGTYFWLDWEARGFWPMEFNPSFEPTSLVYRNADNSLDQRLLFGCRDGHIRTLNDQAFTDGGVNYKSELLIGPIALGGGGYNDGMLLEIIGQLGAGSGDIQCGVKVGKSVEDAYNSEERSKFTLRAGKNLTQRPRLRGNAAYIRLSSDGGIGWAMENMTLTRQKLGKQRLS